jgi:hypothetical protein
MHPRSLAQPAQSGRAGGEDGDMGTELTVRFERPDGWAGCVVTARRRVGKPFPVSHMGGTALPHDLVTFVVERELRLAGGFVNLTAHGAVFRSSGRKFTRPGRAVIAAHKASLDEAEARVNALVAEWEAGRPVPALDEAAAAWAALAPGEALELTWPVLPLPAPGRVHPSRRRRAS